MATSDTLALAATLWANEKGEPWRPHSPGQRDFLLCGAKVKTAACGRRWGKSESSGVDIALHALANPNTTQIVIAPTADQTKIIMGEVARRLYAVPGLKYVEKRSPYWEIELSDGRGMVEPTRIMSRTAGTSGRGLRGWKAHRVIVDEAAFVSDAIMQSVITPLLADYDGQLVKLSTPDGMNHFYDDFQRGLDPLQPRYRSFRFPTESNPFIPKTYIAAEKDTKPERIFAQEYEAAFLDREGAVFRKIMACATATRLDRAAPGGEYAFGVDWGRSNDFTVISVVDINTREMVAMDRFNQIDWELQRGRLKQLAERFRPVVIVAESNSIGQPNIEALQRDGLPVQPFLTTNGTKAQLVDTLALAFEGQTVKILDDSVLTAELMQYAGTKLPSGLMTYGAPTGKHDDGVVSLMLAVWAMSNRPFYDDPFGGNRN